MLVFPKVWNEKTPRTKDYLTGEHRAKTENGFTIFGTKSDGEREDDAREHEHHTVEQRPTFRRAHLGQVSVHPLARTCDRLQTTT